MSTLYLALVIPAALLIVAGAFVGAVLGRTDDGIALSTTGTMLGAASLAVALTAL